MKKWKELIDTFNNLVFLKREGKFIVVEGTNFALSGLSDKLKTINKELVVSGNFGIFDSSFFGYSVEQKNEFFK